MLCRIERRPPRLDLTVYPYLPQSTVATTMAKSYLSLCLLAHHLKALRLPTFLREYDKLARQCAAEGVDHPGYLPRLTKLEMIDRERRSIERRIKEARFPAVKSLDNCDFAAIPSLNKTLRDLRLAPAQRAIRHRPVFEGSRSR